MKSKSPVLKGHLTYLHVFVYGYFFALFAKTSNTQNGLQGTSDFSVLHYVGSEKHAKMYRHEIFALG